MRFLADEFLALKSSMKSPLISVNEFSKRLDNKYLFHHEYDQQLMKQYIHAINLPYPYIKA